MIVCYKIMKLLLLFIRESFGLSRSCTTTIHSFNNFLFRTHRSHSFTCRSIHATLRKRYERNYILMQRQMWERPKNIPFPSVWRRFKGRKKINGVIPNFWIQDIPLEQNDAVVDCLTYKMNADEPLSKYINLLDDETSLEESKQIWYEALKDQLGLICYMEDPNGGKPIFAGLNCTYKKIRENDGVDSEQAVKGKPLRILLGAMDYVKKQIDPFKELDADVLLGSMGLYVFHEFRGQNIGIELLHAREDLCKAVRIKASVTLFTATSSQIVADKAGYKTFFEISYEDLKKVNPEFNFPGIENEVKTLKYGYKVFNSS